MFYPVRPGNRGGRDLFKWDDVRYMKYNDREQYLGVTVCAGYLDKGGKWRKGDWYTKEKNGAEYAQLQQEKSIAQMHDEKRIRQALGLEEREIIDEGPKLTKYEIEEITRKEEMEVNEDDPNGALGLGFKLNEKAILSQKLGNDPMVNYNRLEGEGIIKEDQDKKFSQQYQNLLSQQEQQQKSQNQKEKKTKKDKKKSQKEEMTKEERQKYLQQLENELKELKARKEQKLVEKLTENQGDSRKSKEQQQRRKKSRSSSRNKHSKHSKHHHKR